VSILVFGGTGQIGHELVRALSPTGNVIAPTRDEVDLTSPDAIRAAVEQSAPALVVNAAGYTAVDAAESDEVACAALNAEAPGILAEACRRRGACLVHFSTDYVFDGAKNAPYVESDATRPLNVYGRTKLAGERAIEAIGGAYLIFRTSWVYAARGRNFALTMLRLARERTELSVVDDQIGAPTSARAIASAVANVIAALKSGDALVDAAESAAGVYHLTAGGLTTWYGFARAILADAPWPEQQICKSLRAITTAEYPAAACRPRYSVLDNKKVRERFGVQLPSWDEQWPPVAAELRLKTR
jgi:dTDP-4-dehydrorhamnose reductase